MDNEQFDCETRNRLQILILPSSSCGLNDIDYVHIKTQINLLYRDAGPGIYL